MKSSKTSRCRDEFSLYFIFFARDTPYVHIICCLSLVILQMAIEITSDYTCSRISAEVIAVSYWRYSDTDIHK